MKCRTIYSRYELGRNIVYKTFPTEMASVDMTKMPPNIENNNKNSGVVEAEACPQEDGS